MIRLAPLLLLAACEWVTLPLGSAAYDADGDGYWGSDDCDDYNDNVHPFMFERCNGVDNNCSGDESDAEDAVTWYADADGDGYGDPGAPLPACDPPFGHVLDASDCDDGDPSIHPGAPEPDCADFVDYDCDGVPAATDADRDGWADCLDCAPLDALAHPGAAERCNDADDDCDGEVDEGVDAPTWYLDYDGDGWGAAALTRQACSRPEGYSGVGTDCDDLVATTYPGASEACDGVDQDCDGVVDEDAADAPTWYPDRDHDGFGDDAAAERACEPPTDWLAAGGDCDDADPDVFPGAPEGAECDDPVDRDCDGLAPADDADADGWPGCLDCDDLDATTSPGAAETCDGADDDCDGEVDEDAIDAATWYADADADGYGAGGAVVACEAPSGTVPRDDDCDDADAAVNPGAVETCATEADDDCDGATNTGAIDCTPWYVDTDGDGYGDAEACLCASEAPYTTTYGGDCDDAAPEVSPGEAEVCGNGLDDDCDGHAGDCGLDGERVATAGASVLGAAAGDELGGSVLVTTTDGETWVFAGAAGASSLGASAGAAYGFLATAPPTDASTAPLTWLGEGAADGSGAALAAADFDADGTLDLFVGAPGDSTTAADAGAVFLVRGPLADATLGGERWTGSASGDGAGRALAALPDRDGDGDAELVVGARTEGTRSGGAGAVYVLGDVSGAGATLDAEADALLLGEAPDDRFGGAVASAGDLDGDGLDELLVGAFFRDASNTGAVYVYAGDLTGTIAAADATATRTGGAANEFVGFDVGGGDVDGDGYSDLVVAAPGHAGAGPAAGAVYVEPGPVTGSAALGGGALLLGEEEDDEAGTRLAVGDLDADGHADIVAAGVAVTWIVLGPVAGTLSFGDADGRVTGTSGFGSLGSAVAIGGDADGYPWLVVGGDGEDTSGRNAGAVYLFEGGPGF